MNDIPEITGPALGPADGSVPRQLVIFLHGYGADGNDLIGLAPYFAEILPRAHFISPNAPFPCEAGPFGYQWFALTERTEEEMLSGARMAEPIINNFIDGQLAAHGLSDGQLALIGFSQGTMMSLFAGLRRRGQMAGILGYSGRLVGRDVLDAEISSRPPVVLINGDQDPLIPPSQQPEAMEALKSAGVPVEGHIRPGLGHSIDEAGIEIGRVFLSKIFKAEPLA
ncbi:MAG: dienelactone hydrolase family protein [Rhodospirillales bacterium]|nr:dienelactone hydrolase family protein [Rhodospirillales bacterium]